VQTWKRAAAELGRLRESELRDLDTREAVRQLFGHNTLAQDAPKLPTSGLVEQQAWFSRTKNRLPGPAERDLP
jgi:hypothetical protein